MKENTVRGDGYIKIHFAVNVETEEVVAIGPTIDNVRDSRTFPKLLKNAEKSGRVSKVYGDGAYDGSEIRAILKYEGVEVIIKPLENSRIDILSKSRRSTVRLYMRLGHEA